MAAQAEDVKPAKEDKQEAPAGHEDGGKMPKKYRYDPSRDLFPSVFPDDNARYHLFEHLPTAKVRKMKKQHKTLCVVTGPYDVQHPADALATFVCGRSISTYPHLPGRPARDGDPVCDSYCVQLLEDSVSIAVVCDGCNWGRRPMEASNIAKKEFVEYVRSHLHEINDVRDAGHYLLNALSWCHYKIVEGKEDIWEAGTTTMLGGILLRLKKIKEDDKNEPDKWVWVCMSVGDCKAFMYSVNAHQATDITQGNRQNVYDARDPGGRLGPYVGEGMPDLRNCAVYYSMLEEDDLVMVCSDGVHDNLDPQILGKIPKDIDPQFAGLSVWKGSGLSDAEVEKAKSRYMLQLLGKELFEGGDIDRKMRMKVFSFAASEEDPLSPLAITNRIMKFCMSVTGSGREWMEQNPRDKLPSDYTQFPGKMDHATSVIMRVGDYEKELLKLAERRMKQKSNLED